MFWVHVVSMMQEFYVLSVRIILEIFKKMYATDFTYRTYYGSRCIDICDSFKPYQPLFQPVKRKNPAMNMPWGHFHFPPRYNPTYICRMQILGVAVFLRNDILQTRGGVAYFMIGLVLPNLFRIKLNTIKLLCLSGNNNCRQCIWIHFGNIKKLVCVTRHKEAGCGTYHSN